MSIMKTYEAYHATDETYVESIIRNNFTWRKNPKHWLGYGSYFFVDPALARQWGTNPSNQYNIITVAAFLKVSILVSSENTLDLTKLDNFNNVKDLFEGYIRTIPPTRLKNYSKKKLQCAFFNWLQKQKKDIKVIIAQFNERNLAKKIPHNDIFLEKFNISYNETQICVKDNKCIVNVERLECI